MRGVARRRIAERTAEHRRDGLARHRTGAEQVHAGLVRRIDDRALEPVRRGAAVEDHGDAAAEIVRDMRRGRRADAPAAIGRGRGERPIRRPEQRLCDAMRRHAQRQRIEARRHQIGDAGLRPPLDNQRQRARPERLCELARGARQHADPLGAGEIRNMHDQRIEARPSLGFENGRDRPSVRGVGAEPVDRLRRERDERARTDELPRFLDCRTVRRCH